MTPEVGSYGVVRTNGWAGWGIRVVTHSTVNHAFLYVGDGQIVEAQPAGARRAPAALYPDALWSKPPANGPAVADAAIALIGTPYSWVDCACIGVADTLGWHVPEWVRKRLNRRDRLMCSALVDTAYLDAGVHLFNDGRITGDISPEDLRTLIVKEGP